MWMRFPTMVFGVTALTCWTFETAGISVIIVSCVLHHHSPLFLCLPEADALALYDE